MTFDELENGLIFSADASALVGTVNGAAPTAEGIVDEAYEFDGIDDSIIFAGNKIFDVTNFTVSAWVNSRDFGEDPQVIMASLASDSFRGGFSLAILENDLQLTLRYEGGGYYHFRESSVFNAADNGQWHHIAATHVYDGTNSMVEMYLDGRLIYDESIASMPPAYDMQLIYVGNNYDTAYKREMHGEMDELRLYHEVLDASEIAEMYESSVNTSDVFLNFDDLSTEPAFSSDYTPWDRSSEAIDAGYYWIGPNPNDEHFRFASFGDHSSGTGNMMVVNAGLNPGNAVWESLVTVDPDAEYVFSAWVSSVYSNLPASLQLFINGQAAAPALQLPAETGVWQELSTLWNSAGNTMARLEIRVLDTSGEGNDFALDDISFEAEVPEPTLYLSFDQMAGGVIISDDANALSGDVHGASLEDDGYLNAAGQFDGVDDYITFEGNDLFDVTNFTVTAWVRSEDYNKQPIQKIIDTTESSQSRGGFGFNILNNGFELSQRYASGGYGFRSPEVFSEKDNGMWHYLVGTHHYDGMNSTVKLYLDGALVHDETVPTAAPEYDLQTLSVANNYDVSLQREFDGNIDELYLYPRALTADNIKQMFGSQIEQRMDSESPLLYLTFDELAGGVVENQGFLDTTGDLYGPVLDGEGIAGAACLFDGLDDQIVFQGDRAFNLTSFTMSAWVRSENYLDPCQVVTDTLASNPEHGGFSFNLQNGTIRLGARYAGGVSEAYITDNVFTSDDNGSWHHVAVSHSYDGTNSTCSIYLDGQSVLEETYATPSPMYQMQRLYVGDNYDSAFKREFDGTIDELRLYNRGLSGADVQTLYQLGGVELAISSGLELKWFAKKGYNYQLQCAKLDVVPLSWNGVGPAIMGDHTERTLLPSQFVTDGDGFMYRVKGEIRP